MLKPCLFIYILLSSCFIQTAQKPKEFADSTNKAKNPIQEKKLNEEIEQKIYNHIQKYVEKGEFSGSVLVAKQGQILFKGGFGFADVNKKIKNEADTKFLIGSTTKSITAITLLRFEERGLVDLNAPISKYPPNLNKALADKLTLEILLRMKSGLPNHLARLTKIDDKKITTDEIIEIINKAKFEYEPGTQYSYSNLNYTLIAAILEKVSGLSYEEILKKEIFLPLNMTNSGSGNFEQFKTKRAFGYHVGSLIKTEKNNLFYALGSGSVYSTVEDLYKWDQALYDDKFLSKQSKEKAFNGGTKEFGYYGFGFRIREYERAGSTSPKGILVRHGGTMKGYLANVHRYLDDKVTVIILGNISQFPIRDLTNELKEIALETHTQK